MTLLQAIPEVLVTRTDAAFYLFGEGPLERELVAAAARDELRGRVRIQGFTSQLWSWMKRANVFVSLSLFEGSSNVALEAAAAGCPLILSDIPANRELFDDDSAFFVPASDAAAVARAMIAALGDRTRAEQKAKRAYEKLLRWPVEAIASEYIDLYCAALTPARA
jgi:glycosyltransferase involved in cell wall biosynthesis